jgi:hypothetical protein
MSKNFFNYEARHPCPRKFLSTFSFARTRRCVNFFVRGSLRGLEASFYLLRNAFLSHEAKITAAARQAKLIAAKNLNFKNVFIFPEFLIFLHCNRFS